MVTEGSTFYIVNSKSFQTLEMRKSDIVIAIIKRSNKSKSEQEIYREIYSCLRTHSMRLEKWDEYVSDQIGKAIIANLQVPNGENSFAHLIRDIDTILDPLL